MAPAPLKKVPGKKPSVTKKPASPSVSKRGSAKKVVRVAAKPSPARPKGGVKAPARPKAAAPKKPASSAKKGDSLKKKPPAGRKAPQQKGKKIVVSKPTSKAKPTSPSLKAKGSAPKIKTKPAVVRQVKKGTAPKKVAPARLVPKANPKLAAKPVSRAKGKGKPGPQKVTAKSAAVARPASATVAPVVARKKRRVAAPAPTPVSSSSTASKRLTAAGTSIQPLHPPVAASVPKAPPARPVVLAKPRRPKLRIGSDSGSTAAWMQGERSRPSSFIPAPPRAESPFTVAAPPASSDRLIRPDDLHSDQSGIRTIPVRADIEQGGGRVFITIHPEQAFVRRGDAIEWDFRYLRGVDVVVEEVVIELEPSTLLKQSSFRSHKPGSNRPHRQLSSPLSMSGGPERVAYTIRCMNLFAVEVARARAVIVVQD